MVNDTLNLFVDDNRKKGKQILLKRETRHCNSTKAKNFINRFFPHFVLFFSILRKLFRFEILAKSQHKEGLYHCERRTLCVWIFFSLFSLLCAREMTTKPYALSRSEKKFLLFLFANIFYLLRIEFLSFRRCIERM